MPCTPCTCGKAREARLMAEMPSLLPVEFCRNRPGDRGAGCVANRLAEWPGSLRVLRVAIVEFLEYARTMRL
jgi:hypothetical protein